MKEKLYTIPLNDAVNASDECPFCFIERELEQNSLDFVLGNSSSYMESDIRDQTDCPHESQSSMTSDKATRTVPHAKNFWKNVFFFLMLFIS